MVAGLVACFMSFDEQPWPQLNGKERVQAIRQFLKTDINSGWKRDDWGGQAGQRVIWNGARPQAHATALEDPDMPDMPDKWPDNESDDPNYSPPDSDSDEEMTDAPPNNRPPRDPKSLQIFYESASTPGQEQVWHIWNFFEGEQNAGVDPCGQPILFDINVPPKAGPDLPPRIDGEWKLRFGGYAEDCTFQGIGKMGPSGDVGWLHCPERPAIKCVEEVARDDGRDAWRNCDKNGKRIGRIPVAHCDWE
jgi:hypothetical protein